MESSFIRNQRPSYGVLNCGDSKMSFVRFPEGFLFGASISNYQHFGGLICDLPLIDAAKHSTHYEADFKILKDLGLNAFRTGVDWARIEPEEGKIDQNAVRFYHRYLSKLREMGVKTIIDLYHIGNPRWIHEHGGWTSKEIVEKFLQYIDFAAGEYDRYVDYYVVMNEPEVVAAQHVLKKEVATSFKNINEAIRRSYDIIHEKNSEAMVGVEDNGLPMATVIEPGTEGMTEQKSEDEFLKFWERLEEAVDREFEANKGKFDWISVHYYGMVVNSPRYFTFMVYPEGLREVCKRLSEKHGKPIIITENGLANRDDDQKTVFLVLHLKSLHDAITLDGAKVIGYCWWSFLPGWERLPEVTGTYYWRPFFELVDVDLVGNYERRPTQTALEYSEIIKNQGFSQRLYERCMAKRSSIRYEDWL